MACGVKNRVSQLIIWRPATTANRATRQQGIAMSTFGRCFRVTTFGESHCKGVGAIVDGVPPGLELTEEDIQPQLTRRRPGQSTLTTPRDEKDKVTIMSGTEFGRTLGTPIGLFVPNEDQRPGDYKEMSKVPRPGHADYTYQVCACSARAHALCSSLRAVRDTRALTTPWRAPWIHRAQLKYGTRASSGGGRSSARETIGRVAAGAIAEKWLHGLFGTRIVTWVNSIGDVCIPEEVMQDMAAGWTREEVDRLGQLQLLRDPSRWPIDASALGSGDQKRIAEELKQRAAFETAFLALSDEDETPAYRDASGKVYTRGGKHIAKPPANIDGWVSEDVVALRCPHAPTACRMATLIRDVKAAKDSIGGTLTTMCTGIPAGLGEPVFDRLEAKLAHAMLSLPATKGFEIGTGFRGARSATLRGASAPARWQHTRARGRSERSAQRTPQRLVAWPRAPMLARARAGTTMRGSVHNDPFVAQHTAGGGRPNLTTSTNNAGGTLGGITVGTPIQFRVAIKAVSTIGQAQTTSTFDGEETVLEAKGRHDPCVLPRAPPLLEGMTALVLADAVQLQRTRLSGDNTIADPALMAGVDANGAAAPSAKKKRTK